MPKPIASARSPYFQYDFQVKGQRFHGSTGCATKRDAQTYIDNLRREILLGNGKPEITLGQASLSYWEDKGKHEANCGTTKYQLANLCDIIGTKTVLSSIGVPEFRAFIAKRRGQGVSNASVNREWQLARRVWRHVEDSYQTAKINWGSLRLDEPKERVRELKADEQLALFEALPDDLKPIVEFAILSGQRRSAVVGLRWDKINWQAGEATIINKGGADHSFPLSPAMVQLVLEQPKVDGCPFVFTYVCERHSPARKDRPRRVKGNRYPFSEEGWIRKWQKALKAAGISDFRFHDLRHTSATRLVRQTGNLKAASRLLGHTDIRTTSRYAHVGMDDLRAMMAATESRNIPSADLTEQPKKRRNTRVPEGME
jgi:integrase